MSTTSDPKNAAETEALMKFHTRISELLSTTDPTKYSLPPDLVGPSLRRAVYSMLACDAPDAACLRFLRANRLDPTLAFKQYLSHLRWRTQTNVASILASGEIGASLTAKRSATPTTEAEKEEKADAEGFLKQLRLGKSYVRGTDKAGRPIVWIRVRLHKGSDQTVRSLERFGVWHIESTRVMFERGVSSALLVFDMTAFGLANMDYTPLKFIITTLTSYYPLGLADVVIHNAPWFFGACWRVVRSWNLIPAEFMSHIHFTKSAADLEKLVERRFVPKELGGGDEWVFRYEEPALPGEGGEGYPGSLSEETEAERERLWAERLEIAARFEEKTREWIEAAGTEEYKDAVKQGCGEEQANLRIVNDLQRQRDAVSEELVLAYWQLDPLTRARTMYDRWGWVKNPIENH